MAWKTRTNFFARVQQDVFFGNLLLNRNFWERRKGNAEGEALGNFRAEKKGKEDLGEGEKERSTCAFVFVCWDTIFSNIKLHTFFLLSLLPVNSLKHWRQREKKTLLQNYGWYSCSEIIQHWGQFSFVGVAFVVAKPLW